MKIHPFWWNRRRKAMPNIQFDAQRAHACQRNFLVQGAPVTVVQYSSGRNPATPAFDSGRRRAAGEKSPVADGVSPLSPTGTPTITARGARRRWRRKHTHVHPAHGKSRSAKMLARCHQPHFSSDFAP